MINRGWRDTFVFCAVVLSLGAICYGVIWVVKQ